MKIELENCQKSLTLKDFEEIESKLGYAILAHPFFGHNFCD